MKRKALTKKSLDELAQVMPVLSEKEQSEMVGGDYYYTSGGDFLGQHGDGTSIRIVDEGRFNTIMRTISSPDCLEQDKALYLNQLNLGSTGMTGASVEARTKIVENIINEKKGSGNYCVINDSNASTGKFTKGENPNDDLITINASAAIYLQASNQTDIELTILHEQTHLQNRNMPSSTEKEKALIELQSYRAVMDSKDFQKASEGYRRSVKEQYDHYLKIYNQY